MSERMEIYETTQPWVLYTFGLTHDLWWPPWSSTRVLGYMKIRCECCICGDRTVLKIKMPRVGPIVDRGRHPARVEYLSRHEHPLQRTAPETWSQPLRNTAALRGGDLMDILRDVAGNAARKAASHGGGGDGR